MALDLVEPFRAPLVDRMVLTVINRRQFMAGDFEQGEGGGLYLQGGAAKRFLAEYEQWMMHGPANTKEGGFRDALRDSVRSYAAALRAADPGAYLPFLFRPAEEPDAAEGKP